MISFLFYFRTWNPRLQKACRTLYPCTREPTLSTLTTKDLQFRAYNTTLDLLDKTLLLSEYLTIHTLSKIWVLFWFSLSISLRWIAFLDETMAIRLKWISSAEYLRKKKVWNTSHCQNNNKNSMTGFVFSESPCFPRQSQGKHWDLREAN